MIKFDSFINSIQTAILSANDELGNKNLEMLENFFELSDPNDNDRNDDNDELEGSIDEALTAIKGNAGKVPRRFKQIVEALEEVKKAIHQDDAREEGADPDYLPSGLKPKLITIQYPHQTANGVVMSDVKVPLITLVPLSMSQISEVKLRANLEIQVEEDELLVSFPASQPNTATSQSDVSLTPATTLEITLTPHHGTEGLRKIVEGYEKVLRAQIPH